MSASTERKNRAAAREAGTDKKMLAQQEAEKKAAKSKRQWTVGTILVVLLLVVAILLNTGFLYKHTTAATVGSVRLSPAQLSYYYVNQYYTFLNQNGSYASVFGLDTSGNISALRNQDCMFLGEGEGSTWRDYFLQGALSSVRQIYALKAYANANGITLDESELADIDADFEDARISAQRNGFSRLDNFFAAQYGTGATAKLVRALVEDGTLASKVIDLYADSLSYDEQQLEEYYANLNGSADYYDYDYYYVSGTTEDGATEQTMLEARMTAEAIAMSFRDGADIDDLSERFAAALEAEDDTAAPVQRRSAVGSGLGDLGEWLRDSARVSGDITVLEDANAEGYYVALFLNRDDNHYPTVSVRHILIKAEASEDGTYSEEAKLAALERINEIMDEFDATDRSEDSFAALANQYSQDEGSNTTGGLYENLYKNATVTEFNDFCFAPHKSGDLGVVYGENGSYAGYHLIYFVGEGELYSNLIARSDLQNEDVSAFITEQTDANEAQLRFFSKLVG